MLGGGGGWKGQASFPSELAVPRVVVDVIIPRVYGLESSPNLSECTTAL